MFYRRQFTAGFCSVLFHARLITDTCQLSNEFCHICEYRYIDSLLLVNFFDVVCTMKMYKTTFRDTRIRAHIYNFLKMLLFF
jgi:hypothetical protein